MGIYDINKILDIFLENISDETNDEIRKRTKEMFYNDIREEIVIKEKEKIIAEVTKDSAKIIQEAERQKEELINQGKKEVEKSKAMYAIEKAKNLFRDGIIVAFIVEILVNQCTDLITPFKAVVHDASSYNIVLITMVIVSILILILYLLVKKTYFSKIEEFIKKDDIKENFNGSTV